MASPRTIVEKADLAVQNLIDNGGYLNPMQANQFIKLIQDQPTIVNEIRTVPMNAPTMEINSIGFASRILKAAPTAGSALAVGNRSAPTTDQITLTTKKVMAEVHIPYDVLEDNIERASLEDTIMAQITERASLDIEELIINGYTGSGDAYLSLMNGILRQATSHVVDYTGDPQSITKDVFKHPLLAMPNKYLRNRSGMRHYVGPSVEIEYADYLAGRGTALGDSRLTQQYTGLLNAFGVPVVGCALMPDDQMIFTFPQNIILGVQRQIMIESDRDIRAQVLVIVLTMRLDVKFETEDAVVKSTGLNISTTSTTA